MCVRFAWHIILLNWQTSNIEKKTIRYVQVHDKENKNKLLIIINF
jgi:hypothetical protein